ncbi:cysteine desulfurase [Acetoanaerobium pronyense]|uniref:Cysteine desulfurase IscS n=1 Tax=Acetoanaerobium pronyense TaxID=1482736 RepID=A0ABS4KJ63_9FIRM|nr:cysteine desulfurase NifS [Acetoanaerobium pronyense]MBP2027800.1 cysteine desulfurase [Acetoanaerobium pronyense]
MELNRVYLDNAATTPVKPEILDSMLDFYKEGYGNPSSIHSFGREVKSHIDIARENVANLLNASAKEIYFTGGGSEADNWAIKGIALRYMNQDKHIITTEIEHHAVLDTCKYLEKNHGFKVTYLKIKENGIIDIEEFKSAITKDTILTSIMFANNEIGTIQPIKEIGAICRENNIVFHTDAVQAVGNVHIDVKDMNIDMLSLSGHKIYAPKGVGALYIRNGIRLDNLIHGGGQERKKRAGTENVAGIVALGKACEIANKGLDEHISKLTALRDDLISRIQAVIPHTIVTGDLEKRLPSIASFCFKFIEGEALLLSLDLVGIAGSSGSACTSGSLDPSHVLMALGLTHEVAHGSLRLSLSDFTTKEEIDYVVEKLPPIVERLRNMSPLYEDFLKGEK